MTAEDSIASNSATNGHYDDENGTNGHDAMRQHFLPSRPAYRPEDIHNIVETVDRYNPENIHRLEDYIRLQLDNSFYDRDANLAILKLYQFNPNQSPASLDTTISILIKSLTALPDPDFNLSLSLLSEDVLEDETIKRLLALQQLLEQCRFEEFWNLIDNDNIGNNGNGNRIPLREVLEPCRDFDASIRDFVATTLSIAYQALDIDRLVTYLGLDDIEDVRDFIKEKGWSTEKLSSGVVVVRMPSTGTSVGQTTKSVVVEQQQIKFADLKKIISHGRILA